MPKDKLSFKQICVGTKSPRQGQKVHVKLVHMDKLSLYIKRLLKKQGQKVHKWQIVLAVIVILCLTYLFVCSIIMTLIYVYFFKSFIDCIFICLLVFSAVGEASR